MNIIEFLNRQEILWFPINLELKTIQSTGKTKKMLRAYSDGTMPSYNDFNNKTLIQERIDKYSNVFKSIWIDTKIVNQIDVDGDIDPNIETPYFKSVTKQKPHYFVLGFHQLPRKRIDTKWSNVELLCGQGSYAESTQEVFNADLDIKNYSGNIYEIFKHQNTDVKEVERLETNPSEAINTVLNNIFNVEGEWKSNQYPESKSIILLPSDKKCIVENEKTHSCVQSFVILNKTSIKIRCHSCGEKKINVSSNKLDWKTVKAYYGLIEDSDDKVTYEHIQEYLDDYCITNDLKKKDGFIMKRSEECVIEYEPVESYDDFLDTIFRNSESNIKRTYKKPTSKKNLINYLENIHTDIAILKRDQNIVSFKNGFLKLKEFEFHTYDINDNYNFIGKKFIPFDFNPEWLESKWDEIECPIFDKIISDQPNISSDPLVNLVFYGLLGSLHFPNGGDSIKVVPYLVGTSGTGKSTIVNIVQATFSQESIGTINFKEKTFGKSAFLTKDVIIDADTPSNMISEFGKCEFQKAVSGEVIAIPIKNQKTENQHKVVQRMLFCSQYYQDVIDTGEIIRRIAYFSFIPVDNTNSNLEEDCISTELHKVLIKILLARRQLLETFNDKPFHEWPIKYFESKREDVLVENNSIYRFLTENSNFQMVRGCRVPFEDFVNEFHDHFKAQPAFTRPKKPKVSDVMFSKLKLAVTKDVVCKNCKTKFKINIKCCALHSKGNKMTKYYIDGLKSNDDNYVIDDYDDVL